MEKSFTKSSHAAGKSVKTLKIDKDLIETLEKIPYIKCGRIDIPDYLLELYIKYVRVQHRDKFKVMDELNKKIKQPAGEKLWRKRVGEYMKQLDIK